MSKIIGPVILGVLLLALSLACFKAAARAANPADKMNFGFSGSLAIIMSVLAPVLIIWLDKI